MPSLFFSIIQCSFSLSLSLVCAHCQFSGQFRSNSFQTIHLVNPFLFSAADYSQKQRKLNSSSLSSLTQFSVFRGKFILYFYFFLYNRFGSLSCSLSHSLILFLLLFFFIFWFLVFTEANIDVSHSDSGFMCRTRFSAHLFALFFIESSSLM